MLASNDAYAKERNIIFGNMEFGRIAAIYGANGSGKSNFIAAIEFVKNIVTQSIFFAPGKPINYNTHKLSDSSTPSTFSLQFVYDNIRYAYGFSILNGFILEEYLYFFPRKRQTKIFSRKGMNIFAGNQFKTFFTLSLDSLQENRLFLSCAANFSRVQEIKNVFQFFNENIIVYKVNIDEPRQNNWYEYSVSIIQQNSSIRQKFLKVLQFFDTGIQDIKTEIKHFSAEDVAKNIPEDFLNAIITPDAKENGFTRFDAKVMYEKFSTDLTTEEATGIQKLFQIVCPILDIIEKGKILVYDEIETGLHEAIVHKIIELFYVMQPQNNAQLIFSTHNTSLLTTSLFRRDQIWFTQLNAERSTDLYSLVEIKNVRKNENLAKNYIQGKYGAIPMLNHTFQDILFSNTYN